MGLKIHLLLLQQFMTIIQFIKRWTELRVSRLIIIAFGLKNQLKIFSGFDRYPHCIFITIGTAVCHGIDRKHKFPVFFKRAFILDKMLMQDCLSVNKDTEPEEIKM